MGIKDIKLGKRSRILEEQERKAAEAAERATEDIDFVAVHPPLPGPANPTSLRGCGCAKYHIPPGEDAIEIDGGVHRYSKPCYRVAPDGARQYHDYVVGRTIDARVAALEAVVADLVARLP